MKSWKGVQYSDVMTWIQYSEKQQKKCVKWNHKDLQTWIDNGCNEEEGLNVVELCIRYCDLTVLPNEIFKLTNLKSFYCDHNNLTMIPVDLGQLTSLEHFHCEKNALTTLPNTLEQLTNLKSFYCHENFLTMLPDNLDKLANLQELKCHQNHLEYVPKSIGQLKNLVIFSYWNNNFSPSAAKMIKIIQQN